MESLFPFSSFGTTAERAPSEFFFAFLPPEFFPGREAFAAAECKTKVRPISDTNEFQTPEKLSNRASLATTEFSRNFWPYSAILALCIRNGQEE
jgi:hypothetical protein